ncbi:MAG: hypothetical protein ACPGTU_15435 [Myxococcota bacterium]
MVESSERGSKPVTGRNFRPRSIGHVWAWIVIATCSVIFLSITMWVVSFQRGSNDALVDKEVVHRLAERMVERWPQVPGPSTRYASEAKKAMAKGSGVEAARWSTKALALDPNDAESWILLIVASSQLGFPNPILSNTESASILSAIEETSGPSFSLSIARSWLALHRGETPKDVVVPDGEVPTLESLLLQWRISGDAASKQTIEDILLIAPGHKRACSARVEMARSVGDEGDEKKWVATCSAAGVELDVTKSHSETLDSTTVSP